MHKARAGIAGALLLISTSSATIAQPFEARGIGTMTCSEFLRQIQAEPKTRENMFFTWAQGFMSGQNFNAGVKRDLDGDIETQKTALLLYCKDNPSYRYIDAVLYLYVKQETLHKADTR